ncbi:MAG: LytR/AlgR family response regulator transcription factor [Chitinophagales bacterium]
MSNVKILVVEDEIAQAKQLVDYLKKLGYEDIEDVQTGEEAIDICESFNPDLLLMDVELGKGMNGIQTVKYLQKREDVPVIYISAKREKYFEEAMKTKLDAFVQKPFNTADLKRQIQIAIQKKNLKQPKYAFVKNRNAHEKITLNDILWIEASRAYCRVRMGHKSYTLSMSLKECEKRLSKSHFIRIHSSFIVNVHQIESKVTINKRKYLSIRGLEIMDSDSHPSMDEGNNKIPISRKYGDNLKRFFGGL